MSKVKFIDRMSQGKISRRDAMRAAGAFGVGMMAMPRNPLAAEPLTIMEWSGYEAPEYFGSYIAKYGSPPNFSIFANVCRVCPRMSWLRSSAVCPPTYTIPL